MTTKIAKQYKRKSISSAYQAFFNISDLLKQ